MTPEDAVNLREDNFTNKMDVGIKRQILQQLERIMRTNPFGQTFVTAGDLIEESKAKNSGEIPRFQVLFFLWVKIGFTVDCAVV